jgi:hypothetical protein
MAGRAAPPGNAMRNEQAIFVGGASAAIPAKHDFKPNGADKKARFRELLFSAVNARQHRTD